MMLLAAASMWVGGQAAYGQCEYVISHVLPNGPTCGGLPYAPQIHAIADDTSVCGHATAYVLCPQLPFVWHPGDAALTMLPLPAGMVEGRAEDMNASGVVVGYSKDAGETSHPCWWVNGVPALLPMPAGFTTGVAEAVNSQGVVAGSVGNGVIFHGVTWTNGIVQDLHPFAPLEFNSSQAQGISSTGVVVGWALNTAQPNSMRGVMWQADVVTVLPPIVGGVNSRAIAVNSSSEIVGSGTISLGIGRSFLWRSGALTDIGILAGYQTTQVGAINDSGRIAGWFENGAANRSYIWHAGALSTVIVDGLPLNRRLVDINSDGTVGNGRTLYQPVPRPAYDIDQNCAVNVDDLLAVINGWGLTGVPADCSQDGIVDSQDLMLVLFHWGQ